MRPASNYGIMKEIQTRFADRALSQEMIKEDDLMALLEAASFAPSCFNEQPWRFLVAKGERREALLACLTEKNQEWAGKAPVLLLLLSKKTFTQGGRDNFWHLSDAGCAAGFLMLEAERRGLVAHPMAGFNRKQTRETFQIPEDLEIIEVIAIGKRGDVSELSPENQVRNRPNFRRPVSESLL